MRETGKESHTDRQREREDTCKEWMTCVDGVLAVRAKGRRETFSSYVTVYPLTPSLEEQGHGTAP